MPSIDEMSHDTVAVDSHGKKGEKDKSRDVQSLPNSASLSCCASPTKDRSSFLKICGHLNGAGQFKTWPWKTFDTFNPGFPINGGTPIAEWFIMTKPAIKWMI